MKIKTPHFDDVQSAFKQLGFPSLRPIQEAAADPILQGKNSLIIAPTSGGKTEAAVLPALCAMKANKAIPVSIIYLAPMRALLNDLHPRLVRLAAVYPFSVCKWHSDVEIAVRHGFMQAPDDILLTTPESLEALFLFHHSWSATHLSNVRMVIIDELHAFADNDRGAHLFGLLERLKTQYCGDFQRIALSATVGNPTTLLAALSTGSRRNQKLVSLSQTATPTEINIRHARHDPAFQSVLTDLCRSSRQLIFTESRQSVEHIATVLKKNGTQALLTHSSLPATHRETSEQLFQKTIDSQLVSTCVLEMGIDIGDLEHIIQINAPHSVNSFCQRLGRAGRRHGQTRKYTFVCRHQMALLQATALVHLQQTGFMEPMVPLNTAAHILAQQLLSMAFSQQHLTIRQALDSVLGAVPFTRLNRKSCDALIAYMQTNGLLQNGPILLPGPKGSQLFDGPKKQFLCSDFSTPPEYIVLHSTKEIGRLDVLFVWGRKDGEFRFTLGGRHWIAMEINHRKRLISALPVRDAPDSVWTGNGLPLSYQLCQEMQKILISRVPSPFWEPSAAFEMACMRDNYGFLREDALVLRRVSKNKWCLYTFAGGKANAFIAAFLNSTEKMPATHSNVGITFLEMPQPTPILTALNRIRKNLNRLTAPSTLQNLPIPNHFSKFDYCLPPQLRHAVVAEQRFDAASAKRILKKKVHKI
ncbi:MAG: DEAD/DEAH box helicase [Deltaproteobacteria bacterium]|nr:DEAD/DEAH box helicase [Deltaproteobacteria bacterium]